MPRPRLNLPTKAALEKLAVAGVQPSHEQVLWLHELGMAVQMPAGIDRHLAGFPVRVGNVTLYPPTIGCSTWFCDYAVPWFEGQAHMADLAMAFALSNATHPDVLYRMTTAKDATATLKGWKRNLSCTWEDLLAGIDEIMGVGDGSAGSDDDGAKRREEQTDTIRGWGPVVSMLAMKCGGTPQDWLWKTPQECAIAMAGEIAWCDQSESIPKPSGKGDMLNPDHPKWQAMHRLQRAVGVIIKEHEERTPCQN
jgi:hypothetical protein